MSVRTWILKMLARIFPRFVFGPPRTYIIVRVRSDGRLDLAPPQDAQHLPLLEGVAICGNPRATPRPGGLAAVSFLDAKPSRPKVIGLSPTLSREVN